MFCLLVVSTFFVPYTLKLISRVYSLVINFTCSWHAANNVKCNINKTKSAPVQGKFIQLTVTADCGMNV
jgi:hypothetical protein